MYLVINECVTAVKVSNFSGHYLRNRSTLNIGVLGYIGIVQHKEHSPEVWSVPPVTLCIYEYDARSHLHHIPLAFIRMRFLGHLTYVPPFGLKSHPSFPDTCHVQIASKSSDVLL